MKARKTRAFYIETLLLTFLILAMLSILVQVFGKARETSTEAKRMTSAAVIAQNAVTMFEDEEGDIGAAQKELLEIEAEDEDAIGAYSTKVTTLRFGPDGKQTDDGSFIVSMQLAREAKVVGSMLTATLSVTHEDDPDTILASLDTAKYFPDDESNFVEDEGVIEMEDFETEADTE